MNQNSAITIDTKSSQELNGRTLSPGSSSSFAAADLRGVAVAMALIIAPKAHVPPVVGLSPESATVYRMPSWQVGDRDARTIVIGKPRFRRVISWKEARANAIRAGKELQNRLKESAILEAEISRVDGLHLHDI